MDLLSEGWWQQTLKASKKLMYPRTLAWLIWGALVGLLIADLLFLSANVQFSWEAAFRLPLLAFGTVGALIVAHRPQHPIGWVFCTSSLLAVLALAAEGYAAYALETRPGVLPSGIWMAWLASWIGDTAWLLLMTFTFLLFPNGQLPSSRWRPFAWFLVGFILLITVTELLWPGPLTLGLSKGTPINNPVGIEEMATIPRLEDSPVFFIFLLGLVITCMGSAVLRLRGAGEKERVQIKWAVYTVALLMVAFVAMAVMHQVSNSAPLTRAINVLSNLIFAVFPIALGIAILRHQLYDINLIINRTLVYAVLTVSIIGLYVLIVGGIGTLIHTRGNLAVSLLATGLVAVLFQPLRERLQRGVNRLMYGERDDPYAVLSRLNKRLAVTLDPASILPTVAQTVKEAFKLPYVAITVRDNSACKVAAEAGTPVTELLTLPLVYQRETVGQLVFAPRSSGEVFSPVDQELMNDLAHQAGTAIHAMRLTEDLQRSREHLVRAREEERRRIRRDLHDGLGPTLAAMNLHTGVLRRLITQDPEGAEATVMELRAEIRRAITDIRQLVYDLRPPTLDELGLFGAIRARAAELTSTVDHHSFQVIVEAPESLPPLPAAVEVAAFRIVQEALTNAVKHASARQCWVILEVDSCLHLSVSDDGVGLPEVYAAGVGLRSMRERTEELGGSFTLQSSRKGGTRVTVQLPLGRD